MSNAGEDGASISSRKAVTSSLIVVVPGRRPFTAMSTRSACIAAFAACRRPISATTIPTVAGVPAAITSARSAPNPMLDEGSSRRRRHVATSPSTSPAERPEPGGRMATRSLRWRQAGPRGLNAGTYTTTRVSSL